MGLQFNDREARAYGVVQKVNVCHSMPHIKAVSYGQRARARVADVWPSAACAHQAKKFISLWFT